MTGAGLPQKGADSIHVTQVAVVTGFGPVVHLGFWVEQPFAKMFHSQTEYILEGPFGRNGMPFSVL